MTQNCYILTQTRYIFESLNVEELTFYISVTLECMVGCQVT